MKCWICHSPAETGEHKIKKSLLVAQHGKGPYLGDNALLHVINGIAHKIQGPNAATLKYNHCLCAKCNNEKTQLFDFAYDKFHQYIMNNEASIIKHRVIDFARIYGDKFEDGQRNLFKYFVKLFGRDLAKHKLDIPNDLVNIFDKEVFLTRLRITFAVNEDVLQLLPPEHRPLGVGELRNSVQNLLLLKVPRYRWHTYFSFLHIFYWYNWDVDGPFGANWIADSRFLYLGSYYPLTTEQREKFYKKQSLETG